MMLCTHRICMYSKKFHKTQLLFFSYRVFFVVFLKEIQVYKTDLASDYWEKLHTVAKFEETIKNLSPAVL